MSPGDPWRRVVIGGPGPFFDYWAPPAPLKATLTADLIRTWIEPFCLAITRERLEAALAVRWNQIQPALVWRLLCERSWRARVAGAYLAGLRQFEQFAHPIGGHLLRSEIPYAGRSYCLALARFATPVTAAILCRYLDYYLDRSDLIFDQCAAIGAIAYLDRVRGTTLLDQYRTGWDRYAESKEGISLDVTLEQFADQVRVLEEIEALLGQAEHP